jgi:hypothetical protein
MTCSHSNSNNNQPSWQGQHICVRISFTERRNAVLALFDAESRKSMQYTVDYTADYLRLRVDGATRSLDFNGWN